MASVRLYVSIPPGVPGGRGRSSASSSQASGMSLSSQHLGTCSKELLLSTHVCLCENELEFESEFERSAYYKEDIL